MLTKVSLTEFQHAAETPEDLTNPRLLGRPLLQEVWAESQESAFLTHRW